LYKPEDAFPTCSIFTSSKALRPVFRCTLKFSISTSSFQNPSKLQEYSQNFRRWRHLCVLSILVQFTRCVCPNYEPLHIVEELSYAHAFDRQGIYQSDLCTHCYNLPNEIYIYQFLVKKNSCLWGKEYEPDCWVYNRPSDNLSFFRKWFKYVRDIPQKRETDLFNFRGGRVNNIDIKGLIFHFHFSMDRFANINIYIKGWLYVLWYRLPYWNHSYSKEYSGVCESYYSKLHNL